MPCFLPRMTKPAAPTSVFCRSLALAHGCPPALLRLWACHWSRSSSASSCASACASLLQPPRATAPYCDHSLICPCGGNRVKRHNRLRTPPPSLRVLRPPVSLQRRRSLASSQLALLNWVFARRGALPLRKDVARQTFTSRSGAYMDPQHSTSPSPAGSAETCLRPLPLTAHGYAQPMRTASASTNRPSPGMRPRGSNSCPLWSRLAVGGGRQP